MKKLLIACSLFCAPIACFASSPQGDVVYRQIWKVLELQQYDRVIEEANYCILSAQYTNEDRVHFYVLILHAYMSKEDLESWKITKEKLDELTNSDESAFWEFRAYYDC